MSRRKRRMSELLARTRSTSLKKMAHDVGSIKRKMRLPSVLLPEPDSPTIPKVSPAFISNATSSTDHRHRGQRGYHPNRPPAAKVFFQEETREQHRHCRVKRAEHHGIVQSPDLCRADKDRAPRDVKYPGNHRDHHNWRSYRTNV